MSAGASGRHREPASAARKARGVEMLALGEPVAVVAAACGVSSKTVENWRSEHASTIRDRADERLAGVTQAVVDASAKARAILADATPRMARVVLDLAEGEADDPAAAAVRLRAAMAVLDRGGVPVLTKLEHSGETVSEATLAKLRAALEAARKP